MATNQQCNPAAHRAPEGQPAINPALARFLAERTVPAADGRVRLGRPMGGLAVLVPANDVPNGGQMAFGRALPLHGLVRGLGRDLRSGGT